MLSDSAIKFHAVIWSVSARNHFSVLSCCICSTPNAQQQYNQPVYSSASIHSLLKQQKKINEKRCACFICAVDKLQEYRKEPLSIDFCQLDLTIRWNPWKCQLATRSCVGTWWTMALEVKTCAGPDEALSWNGLSPCNYGLQQGILCRKRVPWWRSKPSSYSSFEINGVMLVTNHYIRQPKQPLWIIVKGTVVLFASSGAYFWMCLGTDAFLIVRSWYRKSSKSKQVKFLL